MNVTHLPVEAAYDRWAALYDEAESPMVSVAKEAVAAWAPLAYGKDVVELGCGTGRNLLAFKTAGARSLVGCDLSEGMLDRARQADDSLRLFQCDYAKGTPLKAQSADLVLISLSLEHCATLVDPLGEAARLLRSGGRLLLIEIHPILTMAGIGAHFEDEAGMVTMPSHAHDFSSYINAFSACGLTIAACREWRARDLAHQGPKTMKRGPDQLLALAFELVKP